MQEAKNTVRSQVRIGYDGRVYKTFRGTSAQERFENEIRVLQHLERQGCDFVPRVVTFDPASLLLVTTNCGARVEMMSEARMQELFQKLEHYGIRHDDVALRNVTYRHDDGQFCLIDFELATFL